MFTTKFCLNCKKDTIWEFSPKMGHSKCTVCEGKKSWKDLTTCEKCELSRANFVSTKGNENCNIMFIGEAPGKDEVKLAEPFVGAAGRKLDEQLYRIGLSRDDVIISNVVKCRPPQNRDPKKNEVDCCSSLLKKEIEIYNPEIICSLGRFARNFLFNNYLNDREIRNNEPQTIYINDENKYILPILHPAAIIYKKENKELFKSGFDKLEELMKTLNGDEYER